MTISSHRRHDGAYPAAGALKAPDRETSDPPAAGRQGTITGDGPAPENGGGREPEEAQVAEHAGGAEGDWLGGELRRLYRTVASEPVPDQLLALLEQLDDRADEPDADDRSRESAAGRDAPHSHEDGTEEPS